MATEEDLKKGETEDDSQEGSTESPSPEAKSEELEPGAASDEAVTSSSATDEEEEEDDEDDGGAPMQFGYRRYVYAAYMAGALLTAFLVAKIGHTAWYRLGQWKPQLGEPQDEILFPIAGVIGALVAIYYWRKADTRQYATEVAEELSKVTWPSRKEVTNSTVVVVLTTIFATVFFALMDRFWGFVTDKIYMF